MPATLSRSSVLGILPEREQGQTPHAAFLSSINSLGKDASPQDIAAHMRGRSVAANTEDRTTNVENRRSIREEGVLEQATQTVQQAPLDPNADTGDLALSAFTSADASMRQEADARRIIGGRTIQAQEELQALGEINREEYKRKRRDEIKPTEAIDADILDIRNKALVGRAALMESVRNLPFAMQNRLIAQHGAMFAKALTKLDRLRDMKLDDLDETADREFDSYAEQVKTHTDKIAGFQTMLKTMEAQGASNEAMAQIRLDFSKELERQRKTKAKGKGLTTNEELIFNNLLAEHKRVHGTAPDSNDRALYKSQAAQIVGGSEQIDEAVESGTIRRSDLLGGREPTIEDVESARDESAGDVFARSSITETVGEPQTDANKTLTTIKSLLAIINDKNAPKSLRKAMEAKLATLK